MTHLMGPIGAPPTAADFATVQARVQSSKQQFLFEIVQGVEQLAVSGDWRGAVRLAIEEGKLSQADIARGLEVTRSTVMRWQNGDTRPAQGVMSGMAKRLALMLRQ